MNRKGTFALASAVSISTLISAAVVSILLWSGIPITVVLPTTAPIWVGVATMLFMLLKE